MYLFFNFPHCTTQFHSRVFSQVYEVWASFLTRWRAGNAARSECQGVFQMIVRWSMVDVRWQPFPESSPPPTHHWLNIVA